MSAKKFALVLLPMAFIFAWLLARTEPAYALGTPQIVSVNPGSGSPVGSNVCIRAKVDWDDEYRAMRIRFGNEGWQESSEIEFERCFETKHLDPGWYTIRVEVDRKEGNWSNITSVEQSYELTGPPKGPAVEFSLTPSGGAKVGDKVTIEVWVDSTNPGAIRITVPCGGVPVEHTTPHFKTTWDTAGCGEGTGTVRVCARHVDDPNWANQTCAERSYTLSSPPASAPTAQFWADATTIQAGQCTWLHWKTTNASVVDIDGDVVDASGQMKVCPSITKYYSLKAQGEGGVATRSLGISVYAQATPPSVTDKFQTGDIIQIGYDVFVIVNGERRLVPNPETLNALGIPRSWINNKGFSDADLKIIPRGEDIPDVARDRAGFDAFKRAYFPNTIQIDPVMATPTIGGSIAPTPTQSSSGQGVGGESAGDSYYEKPGQKISACSGRIGQQPERPVLVRLWQDLTNAIRRFFSVRPAVAAGRFEEGECTWWVAKERPDVLEWLPSSEADAHTWDNWAIDEDWGAFWGLHVDHNPELHDIVVWEQDCGGPYAAAGHVAYITGRRGDTIIVNEANHVTDEHPEGDGQVYYGSVYEIRPFSCMKFIHQPTVFEGEP